MITFSISQSCFEAQSNLKPRQSGHGATKKKRKKKEKRDRERSGSRDAPPLRSRTSPLLDGIDVPEEQQNLPGAALLPVREEQVVAGDAQGAFAGRVELLPEHNILHVGRLDVLGELHRCSSWPRALHLASVAPVRNFESESLARLLRAPAARLGDECRCCCVCYGDKEPINRVISAGTRSSYMLCTQVADLWYAEKKLCRGYRKRKCVFPFENQV